jgi:LysM repeat protein
LLQRWRWWWTVPIIGLLPVVVAAVLASEGRFGTTSGLVPGAPAATPVVSGTAVAQAQPAAPSGATQTPGRLQAATKPTTTATTTASTQPNVAAQPAATATSVTAAQQGETGPFRAYRVQPGDTVKFIAQVYGVSPASIAQASGLLNADKLRVGQLLTIPIQPGWLYRVQPGETLDQIAARVGLASEIIVSASKLPTDSVRSGDVILIPDQTIAGLK